MYSHNAQMKWGANYATLPRIMARPLNNSSITPPAHCPRAPTNIWAEGRVPQHI